MSEKIDFLSPGLSHIRKNIRGIDDSYNNEWDILAELLQNSVDAIRKNSQEENKIEIKIDSEQKEIMVKDNGTGIDIEKLPDLLKPFSTDKDNDNSLVGEKGVGLTFAVFSCNYFEIITGNEKEAARAVIKDAHSWKTSVTDERLGLDFEHLEQSFKGTTVILKNIVDCPLFNLNFEQLKYVLRTRTILGNTRSIWEEDIDIKINIEFKDQNGLVKEDEIPFSYMLLPETLKEKEKINLNYFIEHYAGVLKTDADRRKALFGKVIYHKGEFIHSNNRKIRFYSYFLPTRSMWDKFSEKWGLITKDKLDDEEYKSNFHYALLSPGLFTSVKGMPTGIAINNPKTGYAGYWSNIFILFEDSSLKFDIGRKSIHGQQSLILQKYAKEIFNQYLKHITKYVSRDRGIEHNDWDRDEVFGEISDMVSLTSEKTLFKKSPKGQEAQVCAMFYELAAKGIIKDLVFLTTGYKGRYDLYAQWGRKNTVIEFKSDLRNILRDFDDEQKLFDEIDCIVCWDVTEEDEKVLQERSITIDEIYNSDILENRTRFPNATHELNLGGMVNPVYVIDLKKIINS
ncbi:ATP-binding protein [Sporosarcina sp. UB5]|uniref:ATP-binding protein n=1 Tax=Sporosarcina sp. UB5 TaxID=3047463 RepID=UPI003D7B6C26